MKTAGAIKHKLSQVRFRHMKKRLAEELRQAPSNCRYNATSPNDGLSICIYGAEDPDAWAVTYCDEREDGGERARACATFCPRRSKEQIKDDFGRELRGMTLPEVAAKYPDMAALIWVLDDEDVQPALAIELEEEAPPAPETVALPVLPVTDTQESPLPWWKRWITGAF